MDAVGDVEVHSLSINGEIDHDWVFGGVRANKGVLFLPSASHVLRNLCTVELGLDVLDHFSVNEITSVASVHLVVRSWDCSIDTAKVSRSSTDVNDEGVFNHVKSVSNCKRLGDDHCSVDRTSCCVEDCSLVHVGSFSRCTDDGDHSVVFLRVGESDKVGDEVGNEFPVFLGVLDDTEFQWSEKVECESVFERFFSEKNVPLQEISSNWIFRGSDYSQFFFFMTVGGNHHRAESS